LKTDGELSEQSKLEEDFEDIEVGL